MQIFLRAISRGYEPITSSFVPGGAAMHVTSRRAIAMLVLLPDRADGLADLERTLDATRLAAWTAAMTPAEVNVSLPRFTVDPLAMGHGSR
jgi:hypothetical protein